MCILLITVIGKYVSGVWHYFMISQGILFIHYIILKYYYPY